MSSWGFLSSSMDANTTNPTKSTAATSLSSDSKTNDFAVSLTEDAKSMKNTSSDKTNATVTASAISTISNYNNNNIFESRSNSFRTSSSLDVKTSLEGLQQLANQGSWRMVLEKAKEGMVHTSIAQQLSFRTYCILALMKLRMYGAASDELTSLGNLDSVEYHYESHPNLYPERKGSMVPFTMRWLHAELPHHIGQSPLTFQRLYSLLALCSKKIEEGSPSLPISSTSTSKYQNSKPTSKSDNSEANPGSVIATTSETTNQTPSPSPSITSSSPTVDSDSMDNIKNESIADEYTQLNILSKEASIIAVDELSTSDVALETPEAENGVWVRTWERRKETVIYSLLSHHMLVKQHDVALLWMEYLLQRNPNDVRILSKYGLIQLQIGDIKGAKHTMERMESTAGSGPSGSPADVATANLIQRTRGQIFFALKEFHAALREFDYALERKQDDVIAANNKAVCLMYCQDLVGAIQILENMLKNHPSSSIHETLTLNLCSMYELASSNCVENKRNLSNWLMTLAPDDFDLTSTRL